MARRKVKAAKQNEPVAEQKEALDERLQAMERVSSSITRWKPAGQVLTKVRAHPTIFPLVDRATGVDGWPIERITVLHGPSNHGKTIFAHGLGLSFLQTYDFYAFVDAEYTTPIDWLQTLMGQYAQHPGFLAVRPRSYEETVDAVREFVNKVADARAKGDLDPATTGLIVVDSIQKLLPEHLLKKMLKEGTSAGLDGASGRGAMMKAALNSQWLNELVPLMFHTHMGIAIISREYEAQLDPRDLSTKGPGFGMDYKVGGGRALSFEASILARVTRSWVKEGAAETARVVGERHQITIGKTKVSGKQDKVTKGWFHTSNGIAATEGFDKARDVLELALDAKVVEQRGAWLNWGNDKWNGETKMLTALRAEPALIDTLEGEARGKSAAPEEDV